MSPTSDPSETLVAGPGHLEDNLEHGALLPPRVREAFHLLRQLDLASRLLTTKADEIIGAKDGLPKEDEGQGGGGAGGGGGGGGQKRKAGTSEAAATGGGRPRSKSAESESLGSKGGGGGDDDHSHHSHHHKQSKHHRKGSNASAAATAAAAAAETQALHTLQNAAMRCADEKIALAVHVYDLLDTQIRHIDSDLRRFEKHFDYAPPLVEAERAAAAASATGLTGGGDGLLGGRGGSGGAGDSGGTGSGMIAGIPRSAGGLFASRGRGAGGGGGGGGPKAAAPGGASGLIIGGAGATVDKNGILIKPTIDPNEPVYCFCRQVAFGEMIGCDNPNCEHEWFHYRCVGLTRQPTGNSWLCPKCKRLQNQQRTSLGGVGIGAGSGLGGSLYPSSSSSSSKLLP